MKAKAFERGIAVALAFGAVVFALLLAGIASGIITSAAPYP
jgi:hypothetical protein